jgi:alcohol dehydrogenase
VTDGLGADVVMEAVGVPATFELCTELVRPGGRVANIGVHGSPVTLHLETLWIKNVTITTGLVDTSSTPTLLKLVSEGRLDPTGLTTHRFELNELIEAYEVFADAAHTNAIKVILSS